MILQPGFFTVQHPVAKTGVLEAQLEFNGTHPIFEGHFPGQPVVPGVCMLQIVKELTIMALGSPLQLQKAVEMKFLAVIDPGIQRAVSISLHYSGEVDNFVSVSASLFNRETVFFKFKGIFSRA